MDRAQQAKLLGNDNGGYSPNADWIARRGEDLQSAAGAVRDGLHSAVDWAIGNDTGAQRFVGGAAKAAVDFATGTVDTVGGAARLTDPDFRGRVGDAISKVAQDPIGAGGRLLDAAKDAFEKDPAGASGYALGTVATLFAGGSGLASKVGEAGRAADAAAGVDKLAAAGAGKLATAAEDGAAPAVGKANPRPPAERQLPMGPQTAIGRPAMDLARRFYLNAGFKPHEIRQFLNGIDFTKPVSVVNLPRGTRLWQAQVPGKGIGNYFTEPGTPTRELGVNHMGRPSASSSELAYREDFRYRTDAMVQALKSTAKDTTDTWSVGRPKFQRGGGVQYFLPDSALTKLKPSNF